MLMLLAALLHLCGTELRQGLWQVVPVRAHLCTSVTTTCLHCLVQLMSVGSFTFLHLCDIARMIATQRNYFVDLLSTDDRVGSHDWARFLML